MKTGATRDGYETQWTTAATRSWHPVARSTDLAPGAVVAVELLGRQLVAWRTPGGELGLTNRACVHRGTDLAAGQVTRGGCLRCPYHGWEFRNDGRCTTVPQLGGRAVPRTARVTPIQVREHAGLVWACLVDRSDESTPAPLVPEANDPAWHWYAGEPRRWACQAGRYVENYCDIGHFSILHVASFGNPDRTEVSTYGVEVGTEGRLAFRYEYPGRDYLAEPAPDGARPTVVIDLDYELLLPFSVVLRNINGPGSLIFTTVCPVDTESVVVYWISGRYGKELDGPAVEAAETSILEEDRLIVEGQRPVHLPLDPRAELHYGFDKLAVVYRGALRDLGYP